MRLKLYFQLENTKISIQYRKSIISYIKHAIQEYDENLYHEIYNSNNKKTFCFAPILSKPKFEKEQIILEDTNFSIIFSAYNYLYALHIYNAFLNQKLKKFSLNQNSMTLQNIVMIPEKEIKSNQLTVKMASPIICRNHNVETKKDMYYFYEREEFQKYIRINILEQMQNENLDSSLLEGFEIEAIQPKKVIVTLYEKKIECSIGTFKLTGNSKLLDYLYKAGIGAKKAMGSGLFEIM